jgi:flagellum-specific peptidoglycan hydrolase FlgJ
MNLFKKTISVVCFVLMTGIATAQKSIKKYLKKYERLAVEKAGEHQIPVSIILGVSMVESDAGRSLICKSLNNFFGIKGKNANSEHKMGYKSAYKEYQTAAESFEHFCMVIKKKNFYTKLKGTVNYQEWLAQMNKADYATARQKWIDQIEHTIRKFELYKLDTGLNEFASLKMAIPVRK